MLRSLWVAKSGLDAQQTQLDVISNNLANVSTTAYKKQRAMFQDLVYQQLRPSGSNEDANTLVPVGLETGNGSAVTATQRLFAIGSLNHTSNPLDLAISGDGFFQVKNPQAPVNSPAYGSPNFYTRNGSFTLNPSVAPSGQSALSTSTGQEVLDVNGQPIYIPSNATTITIGSDGKLSYYVNGSTTAATQVSQIGVWTFQNSAGLASNGDGLYNVTQASGPPSTTGIPQQNASGSIMQSYLEQSNVNVAEELVSLISAQRAYEVSAKAITASDQILQKLGTM
jgi:flagellar basal-body rod protein FlgG